MPPRHFTNSRATNFYYSFLVLPPEKRRAIEAVYHFARRGDDAADDHSDSAAASAAIDTCRKLLDLCYTEDGARAHRPELRALSEAIRRFSIPRQPFEDLILGLEMDWRMDHAGLRYETFEELETYCYRVASTIGLIAIEIFGYKNPQTREYAVNLGKALQLVNILRDVQADARRGRIYLPASELKAYGVEAEKLASGAWDERIAGVMRIQSERARGFFHTAGSLLPREDRGSMKAAEIMGAIYWRLLRRIEKRSFNVFGGKITLSRPTKLWTAFTVYFGADWRR